MADEAAGFTCRVLWALRDSQLDSADWKVAVALLSHCNAEGHCWPSLSVLAASARTSRGGVRRSLAKLEAGLGPIRVQVERGRRTAHGDADSHLYTLVLLEGCDQPGPTCDQESPTVGSRETDPCDHPDPTGVITEGHKEDTQEDTQEDRERKPQKRPSRPRQTKAAELPLPSEWEPSQSHIDLAIQHGIDLQLEVMKFRGWADKRRAASWNGRFTTWLGNAVQFKRERTQRMPVQKGRYQAPGVAMGTVRGERF